MSNSRVDLKPAFKSAQWLIALSGLSVGVPFVIYVRPLLPEKYDFDARIIQILASSRVSSTDLNFQRVADVYSMFGLSDSTLLASVVGFLAYLLLILLVINTVDLQFTHPRGYVPLLLALSCGVVFLGAYSKEFVLVLFLIAFFLLGKNKDRILLPFLVLFIYGLLFRQYWIAIAFIWLASAILWKVRPKARSSKAVLLGFAGVLVAFPIAARLYNVDLSRLRFGVNEARFGSDVANTAIVDFISGQDPFSQTVNALLISVSLLVPFPLLAQLNPVYVLFFVVIVTVSALYISSLIRNINQRSARTPQSLIVVAAFGVLVFFEPDYGSYLRHLTPLLPFVILISGSTVAKNLSKTGIKKNQPLA
jgi:hypothetical protein